MDVSDWSKFHLYILQLEQEGLVTRTFRRLDPARQQAVLEAILEEAALRGPAALNIKEVAQRAGVSVGSLYQYFGDRDNMLNFAVELSVRTIVDLFNEYRPYLAGLPLGEALRWYLAGGLEWGKTQVGLVQLFARAAYQGDPDLAERLVRPIAATMRAMVSEIFAQAAARGETRPDLDLEAATRLVHALTIAVGDPQLLPYLNAYFQVTDETVSPERLLNGMVDFILRGVGQ